MPSHQVAIYDTRMRIAESEEEENPRLTNLIPMPAITPLSKKFGREMTDFDKQYQW